MLENCLFCRSYEDWKQKGEILYENRDAFSVLSITPSTPGHAIVIPFRHAESPATLRHDSIPAFWQAIPETFFTLQAKYRVDPEWLKKFYENLKRNPSPVKYSPELAIVMLDHPMLTVPPVAYNIFANNGEEAGQTIKHMHVHIVPRRKEEGNKGGGIAFKKMLSPSALDTYL